MTGQATPERIDEVKVLEPFSKTLAHHDISLIRGDTTTLQINVGLVCNQACRHCHLDAGPRRPEAMDEATARDVVEYARRGGFNIVDITGGAPEMNPNLTYLIESMSAFIPRVMLRANLTALGQPEHAHLFDVLVRNKVVIVASFPSVSPSQADAQRGQGVFERSIATLQRLNELGYGREGSGLELNLVSNPSGAFLPQAQDKAEKRFRQQLESKWGLVFNNLYTFANVPLGRFKSWLKDSGNYSSYLEKLAQNFNPCAVDGIMCRSQVSVDWDGYLYDCDFNLAAGLPMAAKKVHVTQAPAPPPPGTPIAVADHCYTCTAGSGFT